MPEEGESREEGSEKNFKSMRVIQLDQKLPPQSLVYQQSILYSRGTAEMYFMSQEN